MVGVDLDVHLGPLGQLEVGRRLGERAAQFAEGEGLADDLVVALGRVDAPVVPVVQLRVEERRRVAPPRRPRRRVVLHRGRDPAEQEAGLVGAQLDVRLLAVGVGGGRLAVHPGQPALLSPVHQHLLGAGEEMLPARRLQRHRLPRVGDRVAGGRQAHPLVAEQLAVGRLRHAGHIPTVGQSGAHLHRVVNPPDVVRRPVSCFYRLGQDTTLVRAEKAKSDIHLAIIGPTPA